MRFTISQCYCCQPTHPLPSIRCAAKYRGLGHEKPGLVTHARDGSRVRTALAVDFRPAAALWTLDLDPQRPRRGGSALQNAARLACLSKCACKASVRLCRAPVQSTCRQVSSKEAAATTPSANQAVCTAGPCADSKAIIPRFVCLVKARTLYRSGRWSLATWVGCTGLWVPP